MDELKDNLLKAIAPFGENKALFLEAFLVVVIDFRENGLFLSNNLFFNKTEFERFQDYIKELGHNFQAFTKTVMLVNGTSEYMLKVAELCTAPEITEAMSGNELVIGFMNVTGKPFDSIQNEQQNERGE